MDTRDRSIGTQVAFKGAVDCCRDLDLSTEMGQGEFAIVFSFFKDLLLEEMQEAAGAEAQAAQIIQGNFPGTTVVSNGTPNPAYVQPQQQPGPMQFSLTVKGAQHGPLPPWLFEAAAAKGVNEVYDNRDRAATNPKYPLFKATSGGPNAPAFWEPRS